MQRREKKWSIVQGVIRNMRAICIISLSANNCNSNNNASYHSQLFDAAVVVATLHHPHSLRMVSSEKYMLRHNYLWAPPQLNGNTYFVLIILRFITPKPLQFGICGLNKQTNKQTTRENRKINQLSILMLNWNALQCEFSGKMFSRKIF